MTDDDRIMKQQFLRQEILEAGYDGEAFQNFCADRSPDNEPNINQWTYTQIVKLVREFKVQQDNEEQQQKVNYGNSSVADDYVDYHKKESEKQDNPSQGGFSDSKIEKLINKQLGVSNFDLKTKIKGQELSGDQYDCQKFVSNKLYDYKDENPDKIVIATVKGYDISKGGLLDASFALFKVCTSPFNWEVKRRYQDFYWLKKILEKMYPGTFVPPLPSKKKIRSLDEAYLYKRSKILENFLDYTLKSPLLSVASFTADFLSITEENVFKAKQKDAEARSGPQKIYDFQTFNGKIGVKIDTEVNEYSNQFNNYVNNIQGTYKNLKRNSKQIFLDFDSLSTHILRIGGNFAHLTESTSIFNKYSQMPQLENMQCVYTILNNFCINWGGFLTEQMEVVKETFHEFFRFHTKINNQFKDYINIRQRLATLYDESSKKLEDKKEKLFQQKDTNKWDLPASQSQKTKDLQFNKGEAFKHMLSTESEQVRQMGLISGAINNMFIEQSTHLFRVKHNHYVKRFLNFSTRMAENITKQHHQLAETMSYLSIQLGLQVNSFKNDGFEEKSLSMPTVADKDLILFKPHKVIRSGKEEKSSDYYQNYTDNSDSQRDFIPQKKESEPMQASGIEQKYTKKFNEQLQIEKQQQKDEKVVIKVIQKESGQQADKKKIKF